MRPGGGASTGGTRQRPSGHLFLDPIRPWAPLTGRYPYPVSRPASTCMPTAASAAIPLIELDRKPALTRRGAR